MKFIFGGTTEGRALAEQYAQCGEEVVVCVASEYGKKLLPEGILCYDHPMTLDEMIVVAKLHAPDALIDATHSFAIQVSKNIRACAKALGIQYVRIERAQGTKAWQDYVSWVGNAEEAAALLVQESGNVFLSTGINTLPVYARVLDAERLFIRVLPTIQAIEACVGCAIPPSHIVAAQGPFAAPFNEALYQHFHIRHLITKDSGDAGGVTDKVMPALQMGLNVVVIRRPEEG